MHLRLPEDIQKAVVELLQSFLGSLNRGADKVRRDAFAASLELALVEEPKAGRQIRDDCRGLMDFPGERGRRPWFVVVLQESGQTVLVIQPGMEMLPYRSSHAIA